MLIQSRCVLVINKIAINKAITGLKHFSTILSDIFYAHFSMLECILTWHLEQFATSILGLGKESC